MHTVIRYHDFSAGHRVAGHENKCANLHGHNYRVTFYCRAPLGELDPVGRVVDFSVLKGILCDWLENNWDHKFLMWQNDPLLLGDNLIGSPGVIAVPFNPTAENMGEYLVEVIAPELLKDTHVELYMVEVEETRKCSVMYIKKGLL